MNKRAPHNPFLIAGYYSPEYFCDRETETAKIISALENDRNISLISPRRFGKTGLIHHVLNILRTGRSELFWIIILLMLPKRPQKEQYISQQV